MVRILSCLAAFVFVATGAGCVESPASGPVGYIDVPLTASGSGGVTYRLPPGAALTLSQSGVSAIFSLDGGAGGDTGSDPTSQTIVVASGDYSLGLVDAAGDTTVWPLTRIQPDGTTETVLGVLDLAPTITVTDHQTTPLVIRFHVASIGPISFDIGSVDVSVQVDEPTTGFDFAISAQGLLAERVLVGQTAPAALAARLPAKNDTTDGYTVTVHTTSPWSRATSTQVCAQVSASPSAMGNQGLIELVAETPPTGFEDLCIDQVGPQQATLNLFFFRQGSATTPLLSDLGDHDYFIDQSVQFAVAADVFDGFTLDLRPLLAGLQANVHLFADIDVRTGPRIDSWYGLTESGTSTLTLTGP